MDDKEYYLRAEKEYNSSNLDKATLAKANTLIKGDENQIKYKYIELRAEYLKKEALISTAKKYGKKKQKRDLRDWIYRQKLPTKSTEKICKIYRQNLQNLQFFVF